MFFSRSLSLPYPLSKNQQAYPQVRINIYAGFSRSKVFLSVVGRVIIMGVIIHSFNLNISPKMSYGVLECDSVMLQNYMLMTL